MDNEGALDSLGHTQRAHLLHALSCRVRGLLDVRGREEEVGEDGRGEEGREEEVGEDGRGEEGREEVGRWREEGREEGKRRKGGGRREVRW